jgi:Lrp/AsnC family leucine-responsive transcriptional regulator
MDEIDYQIVALLATNGRMPYAQIAARVGMSTATVHHRVKRLKAKGFIRGFTIDVDWEALGYPVDAFISIRDNASRGLRELSDRLRKIAPGPSRTVVTLSTYIEGRVPPLPADLPADN